MFSTLPYLIWTGSMAAKGRNDSRIRMGTRKFIIQRAAGYIVYGSKSREYLENLGIAPNQISVGINTVDTSFFSRETDKAGNAPSGNKQHITTLGYLVARKRIVKLLEVVRLLSEKRNDFVLDVIGDGGDRKNLEAWVNDHGLSEQVVFHGFKQRDELPFFLSNSSCFLFQTDFDIWGLVLNEAMAAGLPCIASPNAAATRDLIVDGETGFTMDFDDSGRVADQIGYLLDHPTEAREIGMRARNFIQKNASIEKSATGFVEAIHKFQPK